MLNEIKPVKPRQLGIGKVSRPPAESSKPAKSVKPTDKKEKKP